MGELPTWIWQIALAALGLGLGLVLGAIGLKNTSSKNESLSRLPPAPPVPAAPPPVDSTQQRLLVKLREQNLELAAQLKAAREETRRATEAAQHHDSADQVQLQRELDEAREAHARELDEAQEEHAQELAHLMSETVMQIDELNAKHANQMKVLEAEIDRMRGIANAGGGEAETVLASAEQALGTGARQPTYAATMPMDPSSRR